MKDLAEKLEKAKKIIRALYIIIATLLGALIFAIGWIYTQRLDISDNQRRLNNIETSIRNIQVTMEYK